MKAFVAVSVSQQFVGMDDTQLDQALLEMIEARPMSVERIIRENGDVLASLRATISFLAAIDLRIGDSAARVLSQRGC